MSTRTVHSLFSVNCVCWTCTQGAAGKRWLKHTCICQIMPPAILQVYWYELLPYARCRRCVTLWPMHTTRHLRHLPACCSAPAKPHTPYSTELPSQVQQLATCIASLAADHNPGSSLAARSGPSTGCLIAMPQCCHSALSCHTCAYQK